MISELTVKTVNDDPRGVATSAHEEIDKLESAMRTLPQVSIAPRHIHTHGLYGRQIDIPAGTLLTGKIHRSDHINVISRGDISVWTYGEGVKRITAPCTFVAKAGVRRVGFAHTDTTWTCFHRTDQTELDKIEKELIADSPADLLADRPPLLLPALRTRGGIYLIRCLCNERMYVGSSAHIDRRWGDHRAELNRRKHGNGRLQNAWSKYGQNAFIFRVLEYVDSLDELIHREQHWIDLLAPYYNILPRAGTTRGVKWTAEQRAKLSITRSAENRTHSPETRAKISAALKGVRHSPESYAQQGAKLRGRPSNLSVEGRARISAASKGRTWSEEAKAKLRAAQLGRKQSPETLAKLSAIRKGRVLSAEAKAKIGAAHRGRKRSEEAKARMALAQQHRHNKSTGGSQ